MKNQMRYITTINMEKIEKSCNSKTKSRRVETEWTYYLYPQIMKNWTHGEKDYEHIKEDRSKSKMDA